MASAPSSDQPVGVLRDTIVALVRRDGPDLSARQLGVFLTCYLTDKAHTVRGLAARSRSFEARDHARARSAVRVRTRAPKGRSGGSPECSGSTHPEGLVLPEGAAVRHGGSRRWQARAGARGDRSPRSRLRRGRLRRVRSRFHGLPLGPIQERTTGIRLLPKPMRRMGASHAGHPCSLGPGKQESLPGLHRPRDGCYMPPARRAHSSVGRAADS